MPIIRLILSLGGLIVTFVFARNVRRERACGEEGVCAYVAGTAPGRMLGVSNTILGLVYYAVVATAETLRVTGIPAPADVWLFEEAIVWLAAMQSFYLLYQLFVTLKRSCGLCVVANSINFAIAATYVIVR